MTWYDHLINSEYFKKIYTHPPNLSKVSIESIDIRVGSCHVAIDLANQLPNNIPKPWSCKDINTGRLNFSLIEIYDFSTRGKLPSYDASMQLTVKNQIFSLNILSDELLLEARFSFLTIGGVSFYLSES